MKIWVDADACPNAVKEILYKAAERLRLDLTLVANKPVRTPPSPRIGSVLVGQGEDVADYHIAANMAPGDLVITSDIPLAAEILAKQGHALNPRGTLYTPENITERIGMRDFMDGLRADGIATGGPPPLGRKELQRFSNALDRILTQLRRTSS